MPCRLRAFAPLLLTLLASGCLGVRMQPGESEPSSTRASRKPPTPAAPLAEPAPDRRLSQLPATLPTTLPAVPAAATSAAATVSTGPKWPGITKPPDPVEPSAPPLPPMVMPNPIALPEAPPKHPIVLAMECVLDNRHEEALGHLHQYDARTQELLLRVLPALALVAKNNKLSPADIAALSDQWQSMSVLLQGYSEFTISKLCFCESIKGYAIYKPLPADHDFVAALPDRPGELVQLYVGIKNFGGRPNQGLFETQLSSHIEIRDDKGQTRWLHRFRPSDLKLVSRTRLNDYYHNYTFTMPPALAPGAYTLTVVVTDETQPETPRTAHSSLPLHIVGPKN